ncbi:ABC transporter permease [Frateuria aurantia]
MLQQIFKMARHRPMMAVLVIFQLVMAGAMICNVAFLLQQDLVPLLTSDGVEDPTTLLIASNIVANGQPFSVARQQQLEHDLAVIPGVRQVAAAMSMPMLRMVRMHGRVSNRSDSLHADTVMYQGDKLVPTLGLKLVAGRDFDEAESDSAESSSADYPVIVSQALADALYPQGALGQVIVMGSRTSHPSFHPVIGIVAHLLRNALGAGLSREIGYAIIRSWAPSEWPMPSYAVRVSGVQTGPVRAQMLVVIKRDLGSDLLATITPEVDSYQQLKDRALAPYRSGIWLLASVSLIVLLVTVAGIVGSVGYAVQEKRRQIGIFRALGACRRHILWQLLTEQLLIMLVGVGGAVLAARGLNLWLMHRYELARLPWTYLPWMAAGLLALGLLSVVGIIRKAAAVPPVEAMRRG